jgi:hypothetical protein
MELVLSGIGILFLLFAWNCAFLPALRGRCVDRLQDLQEENARFFAKASTEDRARVRRSLDRLLSAQIDNIDRVSLVGYLLFSRWHRSRPQSATAFDKEVDDRFSSNDESVNEFSEHIRMQSATALFLFMGRKYSWMWAAAVFVVPFLLMHLGYRAFLHAADAVARKVLQATGAETKPEGTKRIMEDSILAMCH